jgi:molybdopterin-guanine dinucleotide biosynthesis protein A
MSGGPRSDILGVVLAGGRSRRYGSDKAFAELGGVSLVDRAAQTLLPLADRVVVVANDLDRHSLTGKPVRPDLVSGIGPLGGLHTAVAWAAEEGMSGAVVLATDMPFVPTALLEDLVGKLERGAAVVPTSNGPRGFEPLCAAYDVGCLPPIEEAIERGDRAVISFFPAVDLRIVELARVSSHGDPDTMLFNVNRPEDYLRAAALLATLRAAEPGSDADVRIPEEK